MEQAAKNKTDEELAKMAQDGDIERFGDLVERYEKKIKRYGKKFLQNEHSIEDIVQEVFLKAYKNIQSFDSQRKFSAWLYRIAHNEFINELKRNSRNPFLFLEPDLLALYSTHETPPKELEKQEVLQMLASSLKSLDQKYREVLALYYEEEFTYREIADILRIPIATVGIRIKRGKMHLKQLYDKLDNHGPK